VRCWRDAAHPDLAGEDAAAQQNEGVRRAPGAIIRPNATHNATHQVEGVKKWRKSATYRQKSTDVGSVSAGCAVRHNGAGEHDGLVIAVALAGWWIDVGRRQQLSIRSRTGIDANAAQRIR